MNVPGPEMAQDGGGQVGNVWTQGWDCVRCPGPRGEAERVRKTLGAANTLGSTDIGSHRVPPQKGKANLLLHGKWPGLGTK